MTQLTLSITATFTVEPIAEALRFWMAKLGLDGRLEFSGYNQVFQELANPHGLAASSASGASVFLVRLEDWARDQRAELREDTIRRAAREFSGLFREFAARAKRPVIVFLCPPSAAIAVDTNLLTLVESLQAELQQDLGGLRDVTVISPAQMETLYPVAERDDVEGDRESHIAFSPPYFTALATMLARRVRAVTQPAFKVIVVDADNTLWDGVVGEAGAAQVQFTAERIALHEFLLARKRQGMLLALASKNEEADVLAVLERPECILKRDDFVARKINWEAKSRNVAALASELELGLDSFLFLDDNPVECAEVGANCPGVVPLLLPADPARLPEFLQHVWAFDLGSVTAVDEKRTELYRQQGERNQFKSAVSFSQFIEGLDLHVDLAAPTAGDMERAAQLSQRTNQFNASGVRWKASELGALLKEGSRKALLVRVRDRFGDYGEVGFAVFHMDGDRLLVENLLLSCRVLGKGVEHRLIGALGAEALRGGASQVVLAFRHTDRNQPAERFLRSLNATQSDVGFSLPASVAAGTTFDPGALGEPEEISETSAAGAATPVRRAIDYRGIAELRAVEAIQQAVAAHLRRARPVLENALVLPRTAAETKLVRMWEEILHVDQVGVTDSFFSLGGQSLQAASVASRIAVEFGVRVPLGGVMAAPTIEELCVLIANAPAVERLTARAQLKQTKLTQAQQRLWFLDQFIPNPAAYNIPVARRIDGVLDFGALQAALARVVQRHATLRSTIQADGALQCSEALPIPVVQLPVESEAEALAWANQEAALRFDLRNGPLLRCTVYSWGADRHLLLLNVHHIVSDGWSIAVLLRELGEAYSSHTSGRLPSWRPLAATYADYAAWQEERGSTSQARADLAYWAGEMAGASSLLDLPFDKPRPAVMTYAGGALFAPLPLPIRDAVEALAQRTSCTPFMVLLAAWQGLLHRYSRQEDIVVGTPVAGRPMESLDGLAGCFVNTLAIRTQVDGASPFEDHLRLVRSRVLGALSHQDLPFELLVNELNLKRDLSRSPLFQVMFVLQNSPQGDFAPDGLQVRPANVHNGGAKFDLLLEATPVADGYALMLEFNTSLFSPETVQRMLGHFSHFLEQACAAPGTALDLLPMMDAREMQQVLALAKGDAGVASHETTLVALFEAQVERTPEATALVFGEERFSYRELNQRANQLAHHLRRLGVGPNVLVGLFLERSLEMVVGLYGILKAGGAYVPVDPEYPVDRVQFMIEDAAPAVLLIQARLAGQLPAYSGKIVRLDEDWARIAQEDNTNPTPAAGPDDSAYMIYTSGSTGMPKGALNSHRGICNRLIWMQSAYRLTPSDKVLQKTPFSFDVSVWEFFWPLEVGACMVIARPGGHREPEYLVQLIREQQVTVLHFVPSMLSAFLTDPGVSQCESLRHVICSGEALPFSLQEQFFAALPAQLHNLYGPTEAAVDVTHWTCERNSERSIVPIGRPVANTQIYILDGHGALVPIGVAGELYIGGVQVGMGYHKRPELSGEKFVADTVSRLPGQRLYRTGDLARYLPGGEVEYLGRLDHQVKIHGFRIELGEIEATLVKCPGVQEAVVVAREDQPGSKRLVAYLVAPGAPSQDAIREYLKQTLPEYMVPAAFVVLEQLPLSPNGKIDRKALPAPQYRSTSSAGPVAARTPVEKTLAGLWSKVLRVENVGIHDNFFELGGDSILSIQLISLARRDGLKLTAATLFANQTIAELASAVGTVEGPSAAASDKVTGGEVPLTPIQHWFFDQKLAQQEHFNQAYLLEVKQPLDRLLLARAAREVRLQHDALGLRFTRENQGWRQAYASGPEAGTVAWVPCADAAAMEEAARSAQASLNVETGPLWRIVYFDFGAEQPGRLLFVVHHLAVDGVSWGPLLEDLETAYQQLAQGGDVRLPARTSSFEAWAQRLQDFGRSEALRGELPYWQSVAEPARVSESLARLGAAPQPGQNTEASAATIVRTLTEAETRDLLQQVPAVYNTQINDVLLTALTRAWEQWSGSRVLFTNLEGHGREPLFDDADVSRTVGWFTSMFPVRLELPETGWAPGEALVSVKEQLRRIPRRGIGYGALRYLGDTTLAGLPSPQIVFNYFGQVDQLLQDSLMFGFAKESEGPWHSPGQTRAHILEINCRVIRGQLEVACAYSRDLHSESSIASFTTAITGTLRELIAHCQLPQAGRRTPSDFPLARLDQATLDRLIQGQDCEDLYPLTPIQTLFLSSDRGGASASFDQWHCTLAGDLQLEHFQRAWQATLERHPILRSTIHSEGLSEPLQMVHRHVQPVWTVEDWRGTAEDQQGPRWNEFLKDDIAAPLKLTDAPLMRFALRRLSENSWKFVWSVPALLLDGWSWPLVFSEVSQQYHAFETGRTPQLAPVRPYRDYVAWLQRQSSVNALEFWRSNLAGFREPTLIPSEASDWNGAGERYGKVMAEVPAAVTAGLQETARSLRVTLSTLVQGAWAMLLQRQSGSNDVVFGAAFSGRPADLSGAASITGPFVNNLPVRVAVDPSATLQEFFKSVHARTWELGVYQFTPVVEIQAVTEVPWRTRLFDSLVVFQNYLVDDTARRFGDRIEIREFAGPVHTNFPVLLLADPGKELRLSLIFDRQQVCSAAAGRWVRDLVTILEQTAAALDRNLAGVIASLSVPATSRPSKRGVPRPESAHLVPPQNDMERAIAGVWQEMFGIDSVSVDENFFDLGGHSLLLVQIHARLQAKLGISIPIVTLLAHPSIRALARHLAPNTDSPGAGAEVWRNRAAKQREALARPRPMVKR